jgi:hypothetical protein
MRLPAPSASGLEARQAAANRRTYKLALSRALAELATKEPRCAAWRQDGLLGIPIRRIAEKWLAYLLLADLCLEPLDPTVSG